MDKQFNSVMSCSEIKIINSNNLVIIKKSVRFRIHNNKLDDVVPVARMEAFRALTLSRLENFRALKFVCKIQRF